MFKILVDTCVWLDLAKDLDLQPLIGVLEELMEMQEVSLILPRTVVLEFDRHKQRVIDDGCRSLSSVFKRVKDAVDKFGDPKKRRSVLQHLDDVDHHIPLMGGMVQGAIERIERLMQRTPVIELSDAIKLRAAERAIERKAPFHRGKNEIGDAIILETYADCIREKCPRRTRFALVTHNKDDFSDPHGDKRLPHPDIRSLFSRIKSLYFITLKEALGRVSPNLLADITAEEWTEEPRNHKAHLVGRATPALDRASCEARRGGRVRWGIESPFIMPRSSPRPRGWRRAMGGWTAAGFAGRL